MSVVNASSSRAPPPQTEAHSRFLAYAADAQGSSRRRYSDWPIKSPIAFPVFYVSLFVTHMLRLSILFILSPDRRLEL
jgi:hypothetical protein